MELTFFIVLNGNWTQVLTALACDVQLDRLTSVSGGDASRWGWFRRYCAAARTATAVIRRTALPETFTFEVPFTGCRSHRRRENFLISFTRFSWVYCILPVFSEFSWVFLGYTGFYWVLLGFTGFYWVFTGFLLVFYWALLGFNGFYWILPVILSYTGFYWGLED